MSTEVRTTSASGGEKGVKAERYDLLPKEALDAIARVYAFGATKYADHNWRKGYEWSKSYAAAMRHLTSFWSGETNDPESGEPHLGHAGFHIFAMLTWLDQDGEGGTYDDRFKAGEPVKVPVILGVGSEATVSGDTASMGHRFKAGTRVRILNTDKDGLWKCEYLDSRDWWWVHMDDLDPVA